MTIELLILTSYRSGEVMQNYWILASHNDSDVKILKKLGKSVST